MKEVKEAKQELGNQFFRAEHKTSKGHHGSIPK
jgi:hypothetical protein